MDRPSACRGHMLPAPNGRSEEVTNLVMYLAKTSGAGVGLEAPHRAVAPFYSPMILLEMVVQVPGNAMFDVIAEDLVEG